MNATTPAERLAVAAHRLSLALRRLARLPTAAEHRLAAIIAREQAQQHRKP